MRKNWILVACLSVMGLLLHAQGGMTLYNMNYIPQASYLNPGNTPQCNFYLSLPLVSGVSAGLNNDFFTVDEADLGRFLEPEWKKVYGDSIMASFARVAQLSNRLGLRAGIDLFGFGLRSQRHYVSFYIREEIQGDLSFPDEMFRFFDDYNKNLVYKKTNEAPNQIGYVMSGGKIKMTQYRPFTLQYAYDVLPTLTLGGKVSYISGIWTMDASMDTLYTKIKDEDPNDYEVIGRINVRTGGYSNADSNDIANIFINPQNSGWAFGLGGKLTTLEDRLDITFAAVNFGQIYWNQKVGLTSFTDESFENADSLGQVFDTLFRVEEKANVSFKQNLNPEISFGANYYLNKNMSVGALMRVQPVFQNLYSSFGLFFNARAAKWLGFSTGYIYSSRSHNIPLGLTLNPGPVQLYVITDNLLGFVAPTAARQFHLQAGINLTFGKTTRHWPEPPDEEEEIGFLIGEYNPPVAEESQPEPAEPGQPEPEKIGLPPRDTINMPEAGQEPLYKEEDADVTTYMVTNPIFLYRGPSSNTTVLDTIQPNTVMNVLQKRLPDWWYVEYGEQSGWIQPRSIRPSMELPPSVQEESDIPDPLVSFAPLQYIMLDDTPMREEPSETAGEIHLMKKWDEVLVLEKTNSRWWKIRHQEFEGYVKSPMLNPRPENYVRPEETKPAPSLVETYKPPVSSQGVFEVTESTSLRAQPTHESNALLRLRTGMKVNLLEKTSALWWKVEVNGLTGYAKAANLKQ